MVEPRAELNADSTPERAGRIEELFAAALERPAAARAAFLEEACAGDGELRRDLASLLDAHDRPGGIDRLGEGVVGPLLSQLRGMLSPAGAGDRSVGPYRVLERLATGGMGVVYRAWDTRLDRPVALKFLPRHLGTSPAANERFLMEARATAALDHPHICGVHDIGETDDGELYIAMTYYEGETLAQKLERGPLGVAEAISLELQLLSGLSQAHARGIVHRDIKPANVMVTEEGVAKILDFGIAKLADVALTATGAHLGTAAYMSPEQVRGESVDARADLWSAGVVLYEMLAGERPFAGGEREAVLHAITTAAPRPLSLVRPDVPPALERVVSRALAKRRDERYGSALDMARQLEDVLPTVSSGSGPVGRRLSPGAGRRPAAPSRLRRAILVAGPVLVLAAAGLIWKGPFRPPQPPRPRPAGDAAAAPADPGALHSVAVLPFVNLSPDSGNQYFTDGITDELINALSRVDGLRVAARTSSFAFKARSLPIQEVARQLHVADVLEGSVRRSGSHLRISVQLVRGDSGYTLWSNTYDRELRDIFAVQEEIGRAIVGALELRLGSGAAPRRPPGSTTDLATYDLYLWGRYYFNARTESALRTAIGYFQRAVARDSSYAPAYAGLAASYNLLGAIIDPPTPSTLRGKAAAVKALDLDPNLGEAHAALAYDLFMYDGDWPGAERHFRRAIELNPSDATAHHWYSIYLSLTGRHEEALAEIDRALELDPVSLFLRMTLGVRLLMARRYAEAAEHLRAVIDRDPQDGLARGWLGMVYIQQGRAAEAVAELRGAAGLPSRQPWAQEALACAYAAAGRRAEALAILRTSASGAGRRYVQPSWLARAYTALGERDQAFRWLERAYDEHDGWLPWIKVDPAFDGLRSDPRFDRLLQRTGLSPTLAPAGAAPPAG